MDGSLVWLKIQPLERHVNRIQAFGEVLGAEMDIAQQ
jgi:hypothetical protein